MLFFRHPNQHSPLDSLGAFVGLRMGFFEMHAYCTCFRFKTDPVKFILALWGFFGMFRGFLMVSLNGSLRFNLEFFTILIGILQGTFLVSCSCI